MGGSMGAVVGEKVTRAAEHALAERMPLVVVSASGGARMQEGTLALMQLAKTLAALERLRAAGVPFISVLSDPTTGGVFASFAAVGDVNVAETERADRLRRRARLGGHDRPGAARRASSAPNSCSTTASSTASSPRRAARRAEPPPAPAARAGRPSRRRAGRAERARARASGRFVPELAGGTGRGAAAGDDEAPPLGR